MDRPGAGEGPCSGRGLVVFSRRCFTSRPHHLRRVVFGLGMVVASSMALAGSASAAPPGGPFAANLYAAAAGLAQPSPSAVSAWGGGYEGELGNGTTQNSDLPVAVNGLGSGATAVAAGGEHSLALLSNGTVMAWGGNRNGQLGDGSTEKSNVPVAVSGLSGVTAVAAGGLHSLALLSNGTVMAWGRNYYGQLGDGTTANSDVPVAVSGLSGVIAIAAGRENSVALLSNGTVMGWGEYLGGAGHENSDVPVAVSGLSGVTAIATGGDTGLALLSNSTVMGWGSAQDGKLGGGTGPAPLVIEGLSGVTAVACGDFSCYAVLSNGRVMAWGEGKDGELGDGKTTSSTSPVAVSGITSATAIAAGYADGLALLSNGTAMAWGGNDNGDLGDGTENGNSYVPVQVSNVSEATAITAGWSHDLAVGAGVLGVSGVEPRKGEITGETPVTITGTGFRSVTGVKFGAASAVSFTVNSEDSITALSPPGTGAVNVTVTTTTGTSPTTPSDVFTYDSPAAVETIPASSITETIATLNATVNPNGSAVKTCTFEYGSTSSYGSTAPCESLPGSGESPIGVSAAISGLTANTTYHFRISVTNGGGESKGADETFKTAISCPAERFCSTFTHTESHEVPVEPSAVAVDSSGNIWAADSAHDHLLQFNSSREFLRQLGSEGTGESQFKGIGGIATKSSGDFYVTDSGNDRVQEFSSTGTHLATFGSSAAGNGQLLGPTAVAIDESGNVWVLNGPTAQPGGRIVEFSSSGAFISQFGSNGTGSGQLLYADGLAFSGGNLYVSEASPHRVQELTTAGAFVASFDETGPALPSGIATDPATGDLDVSDVHGHVSQFSAAGSLLASFGTPGSGAGQLWAPQAVAVGSSGTIFIADTHNQRLEEWKAGSPPTFANAFTHSESREVPFGELNAVAVDPSGNIWVTDSAHDHLFEFNSAHQLMRHLGSEGTAWRQFKGIGGIAINSSGDVFVSDTGNDRIQEFSPTMVIQRSFGSSAPGSGQLLSPTAVAIDESGDVWVLNGKEAAEGGRIVEFSASGAFISQVGSNGAGSGQLLYADGLAFSGGNLYVSEVSPHRVHELSTSGAFIAAFDEPGSLPSGIATDPTTGDLYVSDINGHVSQFSAAGSLLTSFGTPGSGVGQLWGPLGVAVGSSGRVFIADTGNQRIAEWGPAP